MQRITERKRKGRAAPVVAALVTVLIMLDLLASILLDMGQHPPESEIGILILAAAVLIAVILGVIAAMIQRLRELHRGELEDAKRY